MTGNDITTTHPPDSWAGERKDLFLPYLFIRANPGDTGGRPVSGPFWESPDIMIAAGVDPGAAPTVPSHLGQVALAGAPNTVYAHVWNFGQAAASETVVEFYWCNPTLGFSGASVQLIGQTVVSLGARGSGQSHLVVKCPVAWVPQFLNGGHECLLVRVWDYTSDSVGAPAWDARTNRHIGQRNIHVISSGAGADDAALAAATPAEALTLTVGPLFGAPAEVRVDRVVPANVPWLQLHTGVRGRFPAQAARTGTVLLSGSTGIGGGLPTEQGANRQRVVGDDQRVVLSATDAPPLPGEAHAYRVSASQNGQVFGGYTVVVLG